MAIEQRAARGQRSLVSLGDLFSRDGSLLAAETVRGDELRRRRMRWTRPRLTRIAEHDRSDLPLAHSLSSERANLLDLRRRGGSGSSSA
jgi:hypothetical protein